MKMIASLLVLFFTAQFSLVAQVMLPERGKVFRDDLIPRVDVNISPSDLLALLNPNNTIEYPSTFVFTSGNSKDTLYDVGMRLRGNTSLFAAKKSFKLSFNGIVAGQKFQGLEKMNLNGEHNDPSVIRSKVCWDLLREMDLPGARSNHVSLYINGDYYGLYLNTEHIDEEFVELYFGSKEGNLYKCLYPADLHYLGSNPNLYKMEQGGRRVYELKTNTQADDYSDLAHFIDVLNNTPDNELVCALERVFNIDHYFQYIAFDILTGNWDGPLFNKNNFYLYHNPQTDLFEYIPYDLDNTLGIDWFGENWANRNIYSWGHSESRPLYDRFMEVPQLRKRFTFFMERMITDFYHPDALFDRLDEIRDRISNAAQNDPYRPQDYGFSFSDFLDSYDSSLPFGHTPIGLKPFISTREGATQNQLEDTDVSPVIFELTTNQPQAGQEMFVGVRVLDNSGINSVQLCYQYDQGAVTCVEMYDDGLHNDQWAGDQYYGAVLAPTGSPASFEYYIEAVDDSGQTATKPFCGTLQQFIGSSSVEGLYLNELMASNDNVIADEWGEYDDWLELYNGSAAPIFLGDKYLSDDPLLPNKWQFPDISIDPGAFLIVWIDDDEEDQGDLHASFKLAQEGESIGIYDNDATNFGIIDQISYPALATNEAYGRLPNGIGVFQTVSPTPGASNEPVSVQNQAAGTLGFTVYPNPFSDEFTIELDRVSGPVLQWELLNSLGQVLDSGQVQDRVSLPGSAFAAGVYWLVVWEQGQVVGIKRLVK